MTDKRVKTGTKSGHTHTSRGGQGGADRKTGSGQPPVM